MSEQELIIGLDLQDDFSQLSYSKDLSMKPETILVEGKEENYLIPTVVGLRKDIKRWVYGQEALQLEKEARADLVKDLLDRIKRQERIELYGSSFSPSYLMERFLYRILMEIKKKWPGKTILQLVITVESMDPNLVEVIYKALENLGLKKDRVKIQSHLQSYVYYALSQDPDLWMNDIGLFDFNKKGLRYTQILIQRRNTPYFAEVYSKEYKNLLKHNLLEEEGVKENLGYILENVIKDALYKQIVSTIYFTGIFFLNGIPEYTLNNISQGRRVFVGQNLYCKGACYFGQKLSGGKGLDNIILLLDDTIHYSISIKGYDKEGEKEIFLAEVGTPLYESPSRTELILDNEDKVLYTIRDKHGHIIKEDIIILDNLPIRPNKTTRIELLLFFLNKSRFKIQIKDKGFGEMYPASNQVWEKEVVIHG